MNITNYYFIPRTFMEAINHRVSNDWFNRYFTDAWIYRIESDEINLSDSFGTWLMGGEL